uniref:Uncharacterized protein n=1 Tax=viral metagenome TaxID=1070528 RepID=A0A6C0LPF7_9ZZZZ
MSDLFDNATFALPFSSNNSSQISKKNKKKRSYIVERIQDKRKSLKKTPSAGKLNIPKYIIKQWIQNMKGERLMPPHGTIPLLYCRKEDYSPWLYTTIASVYRKRADWHLLITNMWKGPHLVEPCAPTMLKHPNPFFYNQDISIHLDKLMCLNVTLRMCVLRCVQRRLIAKMDKRVVGEDDLHTTVAIPEAAMVSVYDFKTQAKYVFHTNTILKMILASLKYCAYGIASPKAPKNPYTNLEWTKPQLMSITQQIVRNMAALHRIPPPMFLNYYNCNYNVLTFAKFCEKDLGINAAVELFKHKDDPTTLDVYGEMIGTVIDEENIAMSTRMRNMIIERKLPDILQDRWDNIVLALWIDTNIQVLYEPYKTYTEIIDDFTKARDDTRSYLLQLTRSSRRRLPPPGSGISLIRTHALNILIDAAVYTDNILEMGDEEPPLTVNL